MCRLTDAGIAQCLLCNVSAHRKCPHEIAVCSNQAVHPRWKSYYYKNAGGISTFQGCGFCRYATRMGLKTPANDLTDNPGWSGCCYPPAPLYYSWIPPEDWSVVAAYHHMEIPDKVQSALNNFNASAGHRSKNRERVSGDKLSIEISATRSIQQPVPIPHTKGMNGQYQPRSYSPSAIYLPSSGPSPPRSSISSKDSNSSGSPPSANGSRRRDYEFEGSERSSNSPTSPVRSSSQDGHSIRPSSSLQNRRGESPIGGGKRRSNSDPKNQSPPSAYGYERPREMIGQGRGEREKEPGRDKDRDSPTQTRFKPAPPSNISPNHPYSNPHSTASSSMSKLSHAKPTPAPAPAPAFRAPAPHPRARETSGPSITSVMANMSLNHQGHGVPAYTNPTTALAARARIQIENPMKRGVIPPHVRKAGSVISASSSSSSSTNSSAQEGTVISDGAFTDYLSDDSDFELQRLAEIEAEIAYQEAMKKHEEMEFKQARDSLSGVYNTRRPPPPPPPHMYSAPRIRA